MRLTSAFLARFSLVALLGSGARAAWAQGADATWERLAGPIDPPPAYQHQLVHDPVRHRMLLLDGGPLGEMWELPLPATGPTAWRRVVIDGIDPGRRWGFSAVYDALQDRVILFGGTTYDPVLLRERYCNDVWSLSLSGSPRWSEIVTSGTPPSERTGAVAVFDPVRDRLILFGGYTSGSGLDETWSLELGAAAPAWRRLAPLGTRQPVGRVEAAAIYDPWNDRMVMFGGVSHDQEYALGRSDIWVLALAGQTRWDSLGVASPPPGRSGCVAVLDPVRQQMLVSGGDWGLNSGHWLTDTWTFDLVGNRSWSQLPVTGPLPSVSGARAAFSPERNSVIQYGGDHDPYQSECDELALATNEWSQIVPPGPDPGPTRRGLSTLIVDPGADRLLVFGGLGWGCQHDLWSYGLGDARGWARLPTMDVAKVCGDSYFVLDPRRRRLLAFGSFDRSLIGQPLDDVWALPLDEPRGWTRLAPVGPLPPTRAKFSVVYDARRDRVLLFGGEIFGNLADDSGNSQDDLWELSLSDTLRWRQLFPVGTPGPRQEHLALYDAAHDRMVVFQGERSHDCTYYCATELDDTWALSLAGDSLIWRPLGPDAPVRGRPVIDPGRDRLLLWAGDSTAWALTLSAPDAWRPLKLDGDVPMTRQYSGLVFDPTRDRLFSFGGYLDARTATAGTFASDLFALHFGGALGTQVALRASHVTPTQVELEWSGLAAVQPVSVVRAEGDGPFQRVADLIADAQGAVRFQDATVVPGHFYRFAILVDGGARRLGEVKLSVPFAPAFALGGACPNPAVGELSLAFSLLDGSPARLDVFDLAGRRVTGRDVGVLGAGRHLMPMGRLAPGVYVVRLTQAGLTTSVRAAVIR